MIISSPSELCCWGQNLWVLPKPVVVFLSLLPDLGGTLALVFHLEDPIAIHWVPTLCSLCASCHHLSGCFAHHAIIFVSGV